MKDKKNIQNLDDYILGKLHNEPLAYDEQAWEMMEDKLDKGFGYNSFLKIGLPIVIGLVAIFSIYSLTTNDNARPAQSSESIQQTQTDNIISTIDDSNLSNSTKEDIYSNVDDDKAVESNSSEEVIQNQLGKSQTVNKDVKNDKALVAFDESRNKEQIRKSNNFLPTQTEEKITQNSIATWKGADRHQVFSLSDSKINNAVEENVVTENTASYQYEQSANFSPNTEASEVVNQTTTNSALSNDFKDEKRVFEILQTKMNALHYTEKDFELNAALIEPSPIVRLNKFYFGVNSSVVRIRSLSERREKLVQLSDVYVGYDLIRKGSISLGLEAWYTRAPETNIVESINVSPDLSTLRLLSFNSHQSLDGVATTSWRPANKRLALKSNLGLGLTKHTIDLKSELSPPAGQVTIPTEFNEQSYSSVLDPHLSLGLRLSFDLIPNRWAIMGGVNHRIAFNKIRTTRTALTGYEINVDEFQDEYELFEQKMLENYNHTALIFGFEFFLF